MHLHNNLIKGAMHIAVSAHRFSYYVLLKIILNSNHICVNYSPSIICNYVDLYGGVIFVPKYEICTYLSSVTMITMGELKGYTKNFPVGLYVKKLVN